MKPRKKIRTATNSLQCFLSQFENNNKNSCLLALVKCSALKGKKDTEVTSSIIISYIYIYNIRNAWWYHRCNCFSPLCLRFVMVPLLSVNAVQEKRVNAQEELKSATALVNLTEDTGAVSQKTVPLVLPERQLLVLAESYSYRLLECHWLLPPLGDTTVSLLYTTNKNY